MNKLEIKNFKCFVSIDILLNQFNLLVGANGVGKSSVIQALLLLRSSYEAYMQNRQRIALNTDYLALGTDDAVLYQSADTHMIELSFNDEKRGNCIKALYGVDLYEPQLDLEIKDFSVSGDTIMTAPCFYYLGAERIGPRISQPLQCLPYINVGVNGQHTAQVLCYMGGRMKVDDARMFPESKNNTLQAQVNEWMSKIMPGVHVTPTQDTNSLQAQIKIDNHHQMSPILAPNIGFGISYVLPIITAGLTAERGSILIVENPEAHLHPAAQSAIGEFLGMVSQSGICVVVETHSDHVVNGIQLFVASNKDFHDKVAIHNFSSKASEIQPAVETLSMNESGELSDWPIDFFNQSQIDYIKLQNLRHV